ncbi:hypothetical protein R1flu_012667 [Riccia fluitans]|uniref:MAGE domain-containing protein n=1 Tax=Riccia fluitans TaxID=41844 RepID=A0ABD1ZCA3_9MARC
MPRASQMPSTGRSGRQSQTQNEEENFTQTQAILSDEETKKLVAEVMRYMLFKNYQQPGVPVSRVDLVSLITKNYKQRYLPSHVIVMAQKKLADVFGLEMKELCRIRSQTKTGRGSLIDRQAETKEYVLRSKVPADLRKEYIDTPESAALNSFAATVIGIIKCAGEKCPEEVLWQNLKRLNIREDDTNHPTFGNVKNTVETLTKQRYIQKEKLTTAEGDGFVYELAERALDEQCLNGLNSFMTSIMSSNLDASSQMEYSQLG